MNTRHLPYMRGIDGLRALAVIGVLIYHAQPGWLPGGFLGVELFFVISGFLITAGLLKEWREHGRIDLRSFWLRRARRLLPAVFVLIVATLAFTAIFLPSELAKLRGDAFASFAYVTNWHLIVDKQPYFASFGRPSLLLHLWSLAVEEQFYIVWPIVLTLALPRLRTRGLYLLILALAAGSTVWMSILHQHVGDVSRLYYGTDTRAAGLLAGAALAVAWSPVAESVRRRWRDHLAIEGVGLIALAALGALFLRLDELDPRLYEGGFAIVALCSAIVIAVAAREGGLIGRVLGIAPLRWVGVRSYSIYLWHWPVFALTRPEDISVTGLPLLAGRLALTLALAMISYSFVEKPVREGALERGWKAARTGGLSFRTPRRALALTASAGVLSALVGLSVAVVAAQPPTPPSYLSVNSVQGIVSAPPVAPIAVASPSEPAGPVEPVGGVVSADPPALSPDLPTSDAVTSQLPAATNDVPLPPPAAVLNVQLTAIGDSVLLGAVSELVRAFGSVDIDAAVGRQASGAIPILRQRAAAGTLSPVVIVHLGNNGSFTAKDFDTIMTILADRRLVLVVNDKVPRPWEATNNTMIASMMQYYPNAQLVDWHAASANRDDLFYEDGIHLKPLGARTYADLIASYLKQRDAAP